MEAFISFFFEQIHCIYPINRMVSWLKMIRNHQISAEPPKMGDSTEQPAPNHQIPTPSLMKREAHKQINRKSPPSLPKWEIQQTTGTHARTHALTHTHTHTHTLSLSPHQSPNYKSRDFPPFPTMFANFGEKLYS
jgi:hypothetical protein